MGELANAFIGVGIVLAAVAAVRHAKEMKPAPRPQSQEYRQEATVAPVIKQEAARRVIAAGKIKDNACYVPGIANGATLTFQVDTGAPGFADFSSSYVRKLGLSPAALHYSEWWPGTRYGKAAHATVRELRVGDVAWNDVKVSIYQNWRYAFGNDEIPLLGLAALQSRGVNLEMNGDTCRLTVAQTAAQTVAPQRADYTLSKLRGDEALRRCHTECSAVPWCVRLTAQN